MILQTFSHLSRLIFGLLVVACLCSCSGGNICAVGAADMVGDYVIEVRKTVTCQCSSGNCANDCSFLNEPTCDGNSCTEVVVQEGAEISIAADGRVARTDPKADSSDLQNCTVVDNSICNLRIECGVRNEPQRFGVITLTRISISE